MATVQIGCKLPHGLVLEIITPGQLLQPGPRNLEKRVTLKGANSLREDKRASQGEYPVAFTEVEEDLWNEWYEHNKNLEFVRKGFVFKAEAAEGRSAKASLAAQSKERTKERTGLEPLQQKDDPRLKIARGVSTDEEHLKAVTQAPT